jgi:hypothetical protein
MDALGTLPLGTSGLYFLWLQEAVILNCFYSVLQVGQWAASHKSTEVTTWQYSWFSSLPGPKSTCYRESIETTEAGACLCGRHSNSIWRICCHMFLMTFITFLCDYKFVSLHLQMSQCVRQMWKATVEHTLKFWCSSKISSLFKLCQSLVWESFADYRNNCYTPHDTWECTPCYHSIQNKFSYVVLLDVECWKL